MFLVALPIIFNIDWVLDFWLDSVPQLSNTFAILFIVNAIINAVSMPFNFTVLSSGNIRSFQIITAVVFLSDLPVTYLLFSQGMPATTVMMVKIVVISVMLFVRIFFASRIIETIVLRKVCVELLLPMALTAGLTIGLSVFLNNQSDTTIPKIASTCLLELVCLSMIWLFCFNKGERSSLLSLIRNKR